MQWCLAVTRCARVHGCDTVISYFPSCFGGWARSHLRVASAFLESGLRTNVYVDGFNLYYGALRKTPHRWVNLDSLFQLLLPKNTIQEIKYFTALVSARPNDPSQPQRQQLYLRALATLPKVSVHLGHFLVHEVTMPLVVAPGQPQQYARVPRRPPKLPHRWPPQTPPPELIGDRR